jgi:hypothetical protein
MMRSGKRLAVNSCQWTVHSKKKSEDLNTENTGAEALAAQKGHTPQFTVDSSQQKKRAKI